jgi:hypothetical protein
MAKSKPQPQPPEGRNKRHPSQSKESEERWKAYQSLKYGDGVSKIKLSPTFKMHTGTYSTLSQDTGTNTAWKAENTRRGGLV